MTNKKSAVLQKQTSATTKPTKATSDSQQTQQILEAVTLLKPLADFHKAVESAGENDLRMLWDVRIVRGKDTAFCHVKGASSLPAMLANNMRANAPSQIQEEVSEKIMMPLVSAMQAEVERSTFEDLAKRKRAGNSSSEEECFPSEDDDPAGPEQPPAA